MLYLQSPQNVLNAILAPFFYILLLEDWALFDLLKAMNNLSLPRFLIFSLSKNLKQKS